MAERTVGMGRGLAAILSVGPHEEADELRSLPVELIRPNPRQPRRAFEEESLLRLADSLKERGVLQPVLVRPVAGGTYELIAGERRWRAARLAGIGSIPALVRPHDDATSLELALVENMAREDLSPVEEARACAALVEELGLTREDVGRRVGRSRVAVSNLIRLLDLPDEALALISRGDLSEGHGRALLLAEDHGVRRRLAVEAATAGWSVRELEVRARRTNDDGRSLAPRERAIGADEDAALAQVAGALGAALGAEVAIAPSARGYRVRFDVASLEEALSVVARVGERAEAA